MAWMAAGLVKYMVTCGMCVLVEVELDLVGCGNQSAEVRIQVSCSDLDAQFSGDVANFVVVRVENRNSYGWL